MPKGVYSKGRKLIFVKNIKKYGGDSVHYDKSIVNRLKRVEGQIKGVIKMIEKNKDCKEVITQLSASRSAIDRTIGLIVSLNLEHCVRESIEKGEDTSKLVKEAVDLLVKSR